MLKLPVYTGVQHRSIGGMEELFHLFLTIGINGGQWWDQTILPAGNILRYPLCGP